MLAREYSLGNIGLAPVARWRFCGPRLDSVVEGDPMADYRIEPFHPGPSVPGWWKNAKPRCVNCGRVFEPEDAQQDACSVRCVREYVVRGKGRS